MFNGREKVSPFQHYACCILPVHHQVGQIQAESVFKSDLYTMAAA
jgi:hypothetical protein